MSYSDRCQYMALAITLAKAAMAQTSPNPSVGAVIVKNNQIIGLGSHLIAGCHHAEIHALNMAGNLAHGATLYVTLEPCNHYGKTPPCTEAIIAAGIKHVVVATLDPNPQTNGSGVKQLRESGIEVTIGLLEGEARALNPVFNYYISTHRPYISIKAALSLDGKLATRTNESKWITNEQSRVDAHRYRHSHDAILVGVNTIVADDPALTTRLLGGGKNPIRIILDTNLRTPITAQVITDTKTPTWIITGNAVTQSAITQYARFHQVKILPMHTENIELPYMVEYLANLGITSLLVEGGATVHAGFLDAMLLNQLILYLSPRLLGGVAAPHFYMGQGVAHLCDALKLKFAEIVKLDEDIKIVANTIGTA